MWIRPRKCCSAATISRRGEIRSEPPPPPPPRPCSAEGWWWVLRLSGGRGFCREHAFELPYDLLICAVGAISNTFHTPGVDEHAFFLKVPPSPAPALSQGCRCGLPAGRLRDQDMPTALAQPGGPADSRRAVAGGGAGRGAQEARHAEQLRARINECLELASLPGTSPQQRTELLTFCVVGRRPPSPLRPCQTRPIAAIRLHKVCRVVQSSKAEAPRNRHVPAELAQICRSRPISAQTFVSAENSIYAALESGLCLRSTA